MGNLLLQQERAQAEVPPLPLDVLVAMTEGSRSWSGCRASTNPESLPRAIAGRAGTHFVGGI